VTPAGGRLEEWAAREGLDHHAAEFGRLRDRNPLVTLRKITRLRRLARHISRAHGARIFHSNTREAFNLLAFLPARLIKVAHHRDVLERRINAALYPRMDANVFITRFTCSRCGSPPNGRVILNAGAIEGDLPPVAAPDTTIRMAMFARFDWFKGHRLALKACELLGQRGVDYSLDVWGAPHGDPETARFRHLQTFASEQGLKVRFRGFHDNPASAMRRYHAILNPSRDEPFGRVPVEGFSLGVPVISHASGGTLEIYSGSDDYEAFLFREYSAEALTERIEALRPAEGGCREHSDALARMQADIRRRFGVSRLVDDLEALFDDLARRKAAASPSPRRSSAGDPAARGEAPSAHDSRMGKGPRASMRARGRR
jgi:glycosyltransferase involved in cell wall biosynthesis